MYRFVSVSTLAQSRYFMTSVAGFFGECTSKDFLWGLIYAFICYFSQFLHFIITIRGTIIHLVLWRFFLYSQHSFISDLYPFPLVYWHVFLSVSKTVELVTLGLDVWFGEVVCMYICVYTRVYICIYMCCFWIERGTRRQFGCWNVWISIKLQYLVCTEVWNIWNQYCSGNLWWAYVTPASDLVSLSLVLMSFFLPNTCLINLIS